MRNTLWFLFHKKWLTVHGLWLGLVASLLGAVCLSSYVSPYLNLIMDLIAVGMWWVASDWVDEYAKEVCRDRDG